MWFVAVLPRLERVLERSMMVCLLGLLRTERLANDMSAVTRVMDILKQRSGTPAVPGSGYRNHFNHSVHDSCGRQMLTFLPALKLVFQKVKERFLHHVCHLKTKDQG